MTTPRIAAPLKVVQATAAALMALEASFEECGLERELMELVRHRASQINGCGYCLHVHATTAEVFGEFVMRLHLLPGWRDADVFSPRERAALAWTEGLTRLVDGGPDDADYSALASLFTQDEQVALTALIGSINSWNRLEAGLRTPHPVDHQHGVLD